eukprot:TRINITY_DN3232_c0_g1_i1.p1 TRINITY_DN3232_c0_g1~~TRINITY_DN3232_c0_g1_i1.p1  ORF type:complete len:485 (-),score=39.37 TRINITY_DN3232_c0_g1_i1:169-1563(-)
MGRGRSGVALVVLVSLFAFVFAFAGLAQAQDSAELVTSLPGLRQSLPFQQWTGYVQVRPPPSGRNLFYWFIESEVSPATAPVVMWLTGGPGCSSLLALLTENGPFRVQPDSFTIRLNPYSWNKIANVIYVEAPCGVGFSYALDGNYTTGDDDTAADNLQFVLGWRKLFPQFAANKFFLAGESYAGHYVPQLAALLAKQSSVKFEGLMSGNPSTDWNYDAQYYWQFMNSHAIVSDTDFTRAQAVCRNDFVNITSSACKQAVETMRVSINKVNPYNIYAPCVGRWSPSGGCFTANALAGLSASSLSLRSQTFVPCINFTATETWVQRADVQRALHIRTPSQKYQWSICSQHLNYVQFATSVLPIYASLRHTHRIAIYSGDVDSCVPFMGTQACVDSLDLPVVNPWRAWFVNDQVAGYVKVLAGQVGSPSLSYVTIKNAGHMVPTYQPEAALVFFSAFLAAKPLPSP